MITIMKELINKRIEKKVILDWYDGIVSALIQFENTDKWYLVNLIAWDTKQPEKVYLISEISRDESGVILGLIKDQTPDAPALTESEFDEVKNLVRKSIENNICYLFKGKDLADQINNLKELNDKGDIQIEIDDIVNMDSASKEKWYDLFE